MTGAKGVHQCGWAPAPTTPVAGERAGTAKHWAVTKTPARRVAATASVPGPQAGGRKAFETRSSLTLLPGSGPADNAVDRATPYRHASPAGRRRQLTGPRSAHPAVTRAVTAAGVLVAVGALALAGVRPVQAQGDPDLRLPWSTVSAGGNGAVPGASGALVLTPALGLPTVSKGSAGGLVLHGGWVAGVSRVIATPVTSVTAVHAGWNLLSLAAMPSRRSASSLFPSAVSAFFSYDGTYQAVSELEPGRGYWARFGDSESVPSVGGALETTVVTVQRGWNLVGGGPYGTAEGHLAPVPPLELTAPVYGYEPAGGYYVPGALVPTQGYWVCVSDAGQVTIGSGPTIPAARQATGPASGRLAIADYAAGQELGTLCLTDARGRKQQLYFGNPGDGAAAAYYQLPPRPPAEAFDARFAADRAIACGTPGLEQRVPLQVSTPAYPVRVSWQGNGRAEARLEVGGQQTPLIGSGSLELPQPSEALALLLNPAVALAGPAPRAYALEANHPNPFNPQTSVRYALPEQGPVTLTVYDMTGQVVRRLVDSVQPAGWHTATWDARSDRGVPVSSGVYVCEMRAGLYRATHRMVLVR